MKMTMEALWYKAHGDPDQFWLNQYLKAVKVFGGENHVKWGAEVSVPHHRNAAAGDLDLLDELNFARNSDFETWLDRPRLF